MKLRTPMVLVAALTATPAFAVPPPAHRADELLPLSSDVCLIDVRGSARPYSPATYRFNGTTDETLLLINVKPDLNLNFSLGLAGQAPIVAGAGFGADVRVRLPRTGVYQLQVSSFDPIQMRALAADFTLKIALRGEKIPQDC